MIVINKYGSSRYKKISAKCEYSAGCSYNNLFAKIKLQRFMPEKGLSLAVYIIIWNELLIAKHTMRIL